MRDAAPGAPAHTPSGVRAGVTVDALDEGQSTPSGNGGDAQPPSSNTGAEITVHWLRGGFDQPENEVIALVSELTNGGYSESFDWGRMMYMRHHVFVGGLTVYTDPAVHNMPRVMVDAPGQACEFLGLDRLRVMFCNAELSRADIAFDGAPFSPMEAANWTRAGNVRTRAKRKVFREALGRSSGDTLEIGSRSSEQFVRIYDELGFTRVELELKDNAARGFKSIMLGSVDSFGSDCLGVLRDYLDFVDASSGTNICRSPLLPQWAPFTAGLERIVLRLTVRTEPTVDRVVHWIEHQVAATLFTYHRMRYPIRALLVKGKGRLKARHRSVLACVGVQPAIS